MKKRVLPIICGLLAVLTIFLCPISTDETKPNTASAMQIFVTVNIGLPTQQQLTLECEPTDRIEDIKAKIFDQTAVSVDKLRLFFANKLLEDGNTLQDYSVQKDSQIKCYYATSENACSSTPGCSGIYIDGKCFVCEQAPLPKTDYTLTLILVGSGALVVFFAIMLITTLIERKIHNKT